MIRPYLFPFLAFMLLFPVADLFRQSLEENPDAAWWQLYPEHWVYPLQTVLCTILLAFYWKHYDFGKLRGSIWAGVGGGLLIFALWVLPWHLPWFEPRLEGFDPTIFADDPVIYQLVVTMRFLRLVVVVALIEEIFWRGFLMRYLVKEDFLSVKFGAYTPMAFWAVAVLFMLGHQVADYPAALVAGILFNLLAVWKKNLACCVLAHAVANLALGIYIMQTGHWGFW